MLGVSVFEEAVAQWFSAKRFFYGCFKGFLSAFHMVASNYEYI